MPENFDSRYEASIRKATGDELKRQRLSLGLTQEQMARHLGKEMRTYQRWEAGGKYTPTKLPIVMQAFIVLMKLNYKTKNPKRMARELMMKIMSDVDGEKEQEHSEVCNDSRD